MTKTSAQTLPVTPAGERLAQFLAVQASGLPERMRDFILDNYAPQANLEERLDTYLHEYQLRYFISRGYAICEIVDESPHRLTVRAIERLTGHAREIRLEVEPGSPNRLLSLKVSPTGPVAPGSLSPTQVAATCQQFLSRLSDADAFSGAVLLAHQGVPFFTGAYGAASQRYGAPNRPDTAFNIASVGKMFTGVAIAQLAERGLLDFDAPVGRYLPHYPEPVASRVTLHHLLTHTSGLGDYFDDPSFSAVQNKVRSVADRLAFIRDQIPTFEPGSQFAYSNAGFVLLGAIIERVTGRSYYEHVAEAIFKPVGMLRTGYYERDEVVPNVAMGHTRLADDCMFSLAPARENLYATGVKGCSDGGAYSTVADLERFCNALLDHRLLSPAMTDRVTTGTVTMPHVPGEQYGYGCIDTRAGGQRILGHSGGCQGASAYVDMYADSGYTAIILSNYDFSFSVREHIRNLLTEVRPASAR